MGVRWLTWLALRELWGRRWRSLLSLLALALSVGLVVATGSIGALMQASIATPALFPGAPASGPTGAPFESGQGPAEILWISSAYDVDYDLPAGLAARVEALPGVAAVQPLLRRPVRVQTPPPGAGTPPRPDTLTLLGIEPAPYFDFHGLGLAAGLLAGAGLASGPRRHGGWFRPLGAVRRATR